MWDFIARSTLVVQLVVGLGGLFTISAGVWAYIRWRWLKKLHKHSIADYGKSNAFILYLKPPVIEGKPGHFCHFSWEGDAYRIRDFISNIQYYPKKGQPSKESKWRQYKPSPYTRNAIWFGAVIGIPCRDDLSHKTKDEFEWWCEKLKDLRSQLASEPEAVRRRADWFVEAAL